MGALILTGVAAIADVFGIVRDKPTMSDRLTKEMQDALRADGEKLKALTGEYHGPLFECPCCGEMVDELYDVSELFWGGAQVCGNCAEEEEHCHE